jgi:Tfp pilus assembly protein PilO
MNSYLDRLNLRPFEKRLVVGVAAALFVVVNLVFVFPHFSDWRKVQGRMYRAQRTLSEFQNEIRDMRKYQAEVAKIEKESGQQVPLEDQAAQFQRTIQSQSIASGVEITGTTKPQTRTNDAFFIEQNQTISAVSQEQALVDFLYNLGAGNSLIRVRELVLKPDPQRQRLSANVKLVASYQKKSTPTTVSPAASPARAATPTAKPAGPSGKAASTATKPPSSSPKLGGSPYPSPIQPVKRP